LLFTLSIFTQHDEQTQARHRDSTVDGMKTGHTDTAAYCLVSSALRDGMLEAV
jgi:D-alanyl-D-alanine carboxypeptidase (penicillin-binding protein 5/6)